MRFFVRSFLGCALVLGLGIHAEVKAAIVEFQWSGPYIEAGTDPFAFNDARIDPSDSAVLKGSFETATTGRFNPVGTEYDISDLAYFVNGEKIVDIVNPVLVLTDDPGGDSVQFGGEPDGGIIFNPGLGFFQFFPVFFDGIVDASAGTIGNEDLSLANLEAFGVGEGSATFSFLNSEFDTPDTINLQVLLSGDGLAAEQIWGGTVSVPEPAALSLFALGLIGIGAARRRTL